MQIIIPMSGVGKRFIDAGYKTLKPLIEIDGKTIIEHVVELFPGESNFVFICNKDHLESTQMATILKKISPTCKIIPIEPHKMGPVYAVSMAFDFIDDEDETIVNYCDFGTYWDYQKFLQHTRARNADGAVIAYKGFHPHMLGKTNYAFMRHEKQWMLEIQEKQPFTNNRMEEYASNGTYYFKKGIFVKKYFNELMEKGIHTNNEYYVSMVYNELVKDGLKVSIFEIQHMLQWGTPQDVAEYNNWSNYFRDIVQYSISDKPKIHAHTIIPMAGKGSRFAQENYTLPKPLINVSGYPMIVQAVRNLPETDKYTFICLEEHLQQFPLDNILKENFKKTNIISLNSVTEGQACTCELAIKDLPKDEAILIGACDNGMLFDNNKFLELIKNFSVDAICFTFRNHPSSKLNPQMYGWVKTSDDNVLGVSVKVPISDTVERDHAIVGAFWFRKSEIFLRALDSLYAKNKRVNGEFYVDSVIGETSNMGLNVKIFEVDHYICWGTPNDLKTFEYWQSFFEKCPNHPYRLDKDPFINPKEISKIKEVIYSFEQEYI